MGCAWSDGISNPLEVIEQITYLLFIKQQTRKLIYTDFKGSTHFIDLIIGYLTQERVLWILNAL